MIDVGALPIHEPFAAAATDGESPFWHAINDGEDFELLFAVDSSDAERLERDDPLAEIGVEVTRIGILASEPKVLLREGGTTRPFPRGGFVHDWDVAGADRDQ